MSRFEHGWMAATATGMPVAQYRRDVRRYRDSRHDGIVGAGQHAVGADWGILADIGKIVGKVGGGVLNMYAPGTGGVVSSLVDTGIDAAYPAGKPKPGAAPTPGTGGTVADPAADARKKLEAEYAEKRAADEARRRREEADASYRRKLIAIAAVGGVVVLGGGGYLIYRLARR